MTAALKLIESSRTKRWPEHRIISMCVRIAAIIASDIAAYGVDPTGNSDFAETLGELSWDERMALIATLASLEAKTPAGIAAKARLAVSILDNCKHRQVHDSEMEYCLSFAREVKTFLKESVQNDP
jgi:hypothetical protein